MPTIKHPVSKNVKASGASRPISRKVIDGLKSQQPPRPAQGVNRPDLGGAEQARYGMTGNG